MKRRTLSGKISETREATGRRPKVVAKNDPNAREKNPSATVEELQQQRLVLELRTRGFTVPMIAERLGVNPKTVTRIWARAFEDYCADHDAFVQRLGAEAVARYDALFRVWVPRALGFKDVDARTGEEVTHPPDVEAARVVTRLQRDLNALFNHGQPIRVEHTGAGGGPVVTANVDAMERARLVREDFRRSAAALSAAVTSGDAPSTQH